MIDSSLAVQVLPATGFWASQFAFYLIGLAAALPILFWDWRVSLVSLLLAQFSLGQVLVYRYGLPDQWPAVYFLVMIGAVLILALSPLQLRRFQPFEGTGNLLFRGLLLGLLGLVVYSLPLEFPVPIIDMETARIMLWMVVCALLTLGLTDESIHTGVGLLLWIIPFQSYLSILLPLPTLIALMGSLTLLIALGCSYLALLQDAHIHAGSPPLTEITFPTGREKTEHKSLGERLVQQLTDRVKRPFSQGGS